MNSWGQLGTRVSAQAQPIVQAWKRKGTMNSHFSTAGSSSQSYLYISNSPFSVHQDLQPLQSGEINVTDLIGRKQKVVLLIQLQISWMLAGQLQFGTSVMYNTN